ncbi:MAG: cadherin-like beta sandwich domain-containing protein [Lachnospiraceae bacterium]|nr:cadherin-like beta sandwich domain-containing protein [Lachnospiraceae bacterium]
MKKIYKLLIVLVACLACLLYNASPATAAGVSLTGPGTVRAGDTITLKFNINDSGKYGASGTLVYDSSVVSLSGMSANLNGWAVEDNNNELVIYDNNLTNPINGNKTVITLKFKVKTGVATGTKINISINNITVTDGSNDSSLGSATYSVAVAAPLSTNANLSSLTVTGATLSPAFSAGTTSYDIGEVEFATSKLNITYKTEDSKAKVAVSGNNLSVGKNTVSITVTAESGAKKTYKINVTRKQDPNYVASSNATLSGMSISRGELSPAFSKDVDNYIVYLPYEALGSAFTAKGTAADAKASGVVDGSIASLVEGANETTVVCKAEDGTTKEYKLTVYVMPKYDGTVPDISGTDKPEEPSTEEPTTDEPESEETTTVEPSTESKDDVNDSHKSTGFELYHMIIVGIVMLLVGFGVCFGLYKGNVLK